MTRASICIENSTLTEKLLLNRNYQKEWGKGKRHLPPLRSIMVSMCEMKISGVWGSKRKAETWVVGNMKIVVLTFF